MEVTLVVLVQTLLLSLEWALEFPAAAPPLSLRRLAQTPVEILATAHFLPFEPLGFRRSAQMVRQFELFLVQELSPLGLERLQLAVAQLLGYLPLDQG